MRACFRIGVPAADAPLRNTDPGLRTLSTRSGVFPDRRVLAMCTTVSTSSIVDKFWTNSRRVPIGCRRDSCGTPT